jgi:CMP-N,N'-diacetyllegionaminic acid synthase
MSVNPLKILGIIPAREGSKRVPIKNFRPFADTTLVDLAILQALASRMITTIAVSSDSDDVLRIASKYNDVIALKRPEELSDDISPAIDYVRHALINLETNDKIYDLVVILQPSSPLRTAHDIDACIEKLLQHTEADSCVSVVKVDHMVHPVKLKKLKGEVLEPYIEEEAGRFASQDLPDVYVRNCAVYATWRRDLETRPDVIGKMSLAYVMPEYTSVDINSMLDFQFAEYLYLKNSL